VFVWEGVTNYLTAAAVDDTLAGRRPRRTGQRDPLHLRPAGVLDGSVTFPEAERWVTQVQRR
jgi:hypothetical protein